MGNSITMNPQLLPPPEIADAPHPGWTVLAALSLTVITGGLSLIAPFFFS